MPVGGIRLFLGMVMMVILTIPAQAIPYKDSIAVDTGTLEVQLSEMARDHIANDGLLTILNQAASKPVFDDKGDLIGFMLFDIDPDSVFDLAGIKEGDVVTHIDDIAISTPQKAFDMLRYVKEQSKFSYTLRHCIENCDHYWTSDRQKFGQPKRFRVHVN